MDETTRNALRRLPAVDEILQHSRLTPLLQQHGRAQVVEAVRAAVDELRHRIMTTNGALEVSVEAVVTMAEDLLGSWSRPGLRRVLNLTGVVVHTNLGRSCLAESVVQRVAEAARHYKN
jgi:L-seryl-tRNA(Ser) seleniumtransferase